jgi:hypothetical protein
MHLPASSHGSARPARQQNCRSIEAHFRVLPNRRVRIYLPKKNFPAEMVRQFFGHGKFEMPFHLDLPHFLLEELKISSYTIQPGMYDVREDGEYYMIDY